MDQSEQALIVPSLEPMKIARAVFKDLFAGPKGPQLYRYKGQFFEWYAEREWVPREDEWLRSLLWRVLEDARTEGKEDGKGVSWTRLAPNKTKVANVFDAVKSLAEFPYPDEPRWTCGESPCDLSNCIIFRNCIIDIAASAQAGTYVTYDMDQRLFTTSMVRCEFDADADEPEVWNKAMLEWGGDDTRWVESRERVYGYALMTTRKYAKWVLEYGKIRGGKGCGTTILKALIGNPGFMGIRAEQLVQTHGLDGVDQSKVLVLSEMSDVPAKERSLIASFLKSVVGGDEMTINIKQVRQMRHVVLGTLPIIQTNDMIQLPNTAQSVSSKMIAIPFTESFAGREDYDLPKKLLKELPAIAKRLVDAAIRLEAEEDQTKKFLMCQRAEDTLRRFELASNPVQSMLDAWFVANPKGFVSNDELRKARDEFEKDTDIFIIYPSGMRVSDAKLPSYIRDNSSWPLYPGRDGSNGPRILRGLSLRREKRDLII